jgi:nucleotide-binding universal stress UspA family protein
VQWDAQEAVRRGLPLRVVSAFEWLRGQPVGRVGLGDSYREIMRRAAQQQLDEAVEFAEREQPAPEVRSELVVGFPIPVLTAVSGQAELVVIGDRGLGGVTGLLLGSVAVALAAHAECPVVVVRGAAEAPDPSAPVVVGVDGSPTSEAALAFAYEAASARNVPLVAVHDDRRARCDVPHTNVESVNRVVRNMRVTSCATTWWATHGCEQRSGGATPGAQHFDAGGNQCSRCMRLSGRWPPRSFSPVSDRRWRRRHPPRHIPITGHATRRPRTSTDA